MVNIPKRDLAPRLGFSYGWNNKTVIRGGYGINYIQFNREGGENLLAYNGPYIVNSAITQSPLNPICATNVQSASCFSPTMQGYGTNFVTAAGFSTALAETRYLPRNIATGYVQAWHFGIQRQLSEGTLIDISYVGEHGVKIWVLDDINQAPPNTVSTTCEYNTATSSFVTTGCVPLLTRRPIVGFTGIEGSANLGMLIYHGVQARVEHRYASGLYLLNSFTYSRDIDNASGHLDTPNNDNSRVNLANLRGERGQSAYNQPINDTLTAIWDLPYGRGRHWGGSANRAMQTASRRLAVYRHQYCHQRSARQPDLLGAVADGCERPAQLSSQCYRQPEKSAGVRGSRQPLADRLSQAQPPSPFPPMWRSPMAMRAETRSATTRSIR